MTDPETETAAGRPLMNEEEAAEFLNVSVYFLRSRRVKGGGPPFLKLGTRTVRYDPDDLEGWLAERRHRSTTEADAAGG